MSLKFVIDNKKLDKFCKRWKIKELSVFGSALRADFNNESDLDFLVSFNTDANWSLFDIVRMERELSDITGRKVDLISRRGIESSRNYIRRKAILESAEKLYGT